MIHIVDYGVGNLASISNMLKHIGVASAVTGNPSELINASKIILPGVGSFDQAMNSLNEQGLIPVLTELALDRRIPVLGVCLGMQLLCRGSEEGRLPGLGWIPALLKKFPSEQPQFKTLHMGWNTVGQTSASALMQDLGPTPRFYFVHGYYCEVESPEHAIGVTNYGVPFASVIRRDNIYGVQFHPEKSHRFGKQLYMNFSKI